jgi:hypothetical protein
LRGPNPPHFWFRRGSAIRALIGPERYFSEVAERTDEHLALFKEGVEAEFFASDDELLDKTRYYIAHPDERRRMARAGLERCRTGRYSYSERLLDMLTTADVMPGGKRLDGN